MRILVVGAGATGTVFGNALQRGGAHVDFYVREHHRERLSQALALHRTGLLVRRDETLSGFRVFCSPSELTDHQWDQIWFTTPSDAIRQPWLDEFLPATGRATLVVLQPDPEDIAWIQAHGGSDRRIVQGIIQFSAWQSPLPHEPADRTGISYLLPPLTPGALFEDTVESQTIAATLKRGGMRVTLRNDLPAYAARMAAMMVPLMAGLEVAGWKFDRYVKHEALHLALTASHEAINAEAARFSAPTPIALRGLLNQPITKLVLQLVPWVPGFEAEAFLGYHFRKVGQQTRQMLETYVRHAHEHGLPHTALDKLRAALPLSSH